MAYMIIETLTVPLDRKEYESREADEKKKLLNPIDSKIVGIGIKRQGMDPQVIMANDEAEILTIFWKEIAKHKTTGFMIAGFNVKEFDLPFLVTRSFIANVEIVPFVLKEIVDIREKLSAYKFGNVRGKLREFAQLLNIETTGFDVEQIPDEYWNGDMKKIEQQVRKDLEITETLYQRIIRLRINKIERW